VRREHLAVHHGSQRFSDRKLGEHDWLVGVDDVAFDHVAAVLFQGEGDGADCVLDLDLAVVFQDDHLLEFFYVRVFVLFHGGVEELGDELLDVFVDVIFLLFEEKVVKSRAVVADLALLISDTRHHGFFHLLLFNIGNKEQLISSRRYCPL
jgi:hypothetical protein